MPVVAPERKPEATQRFIYIPEKDVKVFLSDGDDPQAAAEYLRANADKIATKRTNLQGKPWSVDDETAFTDWYSKQRGTEQGRYLPEDPDDRDFGYDFRKAYAAGSTGSLPQDFQHDDAPRRFRYEGGKWMDTKRNAEASNKDLADLNPAQYAQLQKDYEEQAGLGRQALDALKGGPVAGTERVASALAYAGKGIASATPTGAQDPRTIMTNFALSGKKPESADYTPFETALEAKRQELLQAAQAQDTKTGQGIVPRTIYGVGQSATMAVEGAALGAFLPPPLAAAVQYGTMGGTVFNESIDDYRAKYGDTPMAYGYAAAQAALETGFEALSGKLGGKAGANKMVRELVKGQPIKATGRELARSAAAEVGTEVATSLGQMGTEQQAGLADYSPTDYVMRGVFDTALQTLGVSGMTQAANRVGYKLTGNTQEDIDAISGLMTRQAVDQIRQKKAVDNIDASQVAPVTWEDLKAVFSEAQDAADARAEEARKNGIVITPELEAQFLAEQLTGTPTFQSAQGAPEQVQYGPTGELPQAPETATGASSVAQETISPATPTEIAPETENVPVAPETQATADTTEIPISQPEGGVASEGQTEEGQGQTGLQVEPVPTQETAGEGAVPPPVEPQQATQEPDPEVAAEFAGLVQPSPEELSQGFQIDKGVEREPRAPEIDRIVQTIRESSPEENIQRFALGKPMAEALTNELKAMSPEEANEVFVGIATRAIESGMTGEGEIALAYHRGQWTPALVTRPVSSLLGDDKRDLTGGEPFSLVRFNKGQYGLISVRDGQVWGQGKTAAAARKQAKERLSLVPNVTDAINENVRATGRNASRRASAFASDAEQAATRGWLADEYDRAKSTLERMLGRRMGGYTLQLRERIDPDEPGVRDAIGLHNLRGNDVVVGGVVDHANGTITIAPVKSTTPVHEAIHIMMEAHRTLRQSGAPGIFSDKQERALTRRFGPLWSGAWAQDNTQRSREEVVADYAEKVARSIDRIQGKDNAGVLRSALERVKLFLQRVFGPRFHAVLQDAVSGKLASRVPEDVTRSATDLRASTDESMKQPWNRTFDEIDSAYPRAGASISGMSVGDTVKNMSSINSSLENATPLSGVRVVSMSRFASHNDPVSFYSTTEEQRVKNLAQRIAESNRIDPLIVVDDGSESMYILEGGHRYDALRLLGAKSFPAVVVIDEDGYYAAAKNAVESGAKIRPEVLADYPDLQKKHRGGDLRASLLPVPSSYLSTDSDAVRAAIGKDRVLTATQNFLVENGRLPEMKEIQPELHKAGLVLNDILKGWESTGVARRRMESALKQGRSSMKAERREVMAWAREHNPGAQRELQKLYEQIAAAPSMENADAMKERLSTGFAKLSEQYARAKARDYASMKSSDVKQARLNKVGMSRELTDWARTHLKGRERVQFMRGLAAVMKKQRLGKAYSADLSEMTAVLRSLREQRDMVSAREKFEDSVKRVESARERRKGGLSADARTLLGEVSADMTLAQAQKLAWGWGKAMNPTNRQDGTVLDAIETLTNSSSSPLNKLSVTGDRELVAARRVINSILAANRQLVLEIKRGRKLSIDTAIETLTQEIDDYNKKLRKPKDYAANDPRGASVWAKLWSRNILDQSTLVQMLFGRDSVGMQVLDLAPWRAMNRVLERNLRAHKVLTDHFRDEYGLVELKEMLAGDRANQQQFVFEMSNGQTANLTRSDILEVMLNWEDQQTRPQMLENGVQFRWADTYTYSPTFEDYEAIIEKGWELGLDKLMRPIQNYLNDYSNPDSLFLRMNAAWAERHGNELAQQREPGDYYYPREAGNKDDTVREEEDLATTMQRIVNRSVSSFSQFRAREEHSRPVMLGDPFQKLKKHIATSEIFINMHREIDMVNAVLSSTSVQSALVSAHPGKDNLIKLLKDGIRTAAGLELDNVKDDFDRVAYYLNNIAPSVFLAFKPHILLMQKVSLLKAIGYSDDVPFWRVMAALKRHIGYKRFEALRKEIADNSAPLRMRFESKHFGYGNAAATMNAEEFYGTDKVKRGRVKRVLDKGLDWFHDADTRTIITFYEAALNHALAQGMSREDARVKALDITEQWTRDTQASFLPMDISQMQRNAHRSPWKKMVYGMFISEPVKNYSLLMKAVDEYRHGGSAGKFAKHLAVQLMMTAMVSTLQQAMFGSARDKEGEVDFVKLMRQWGLRFFGNQVGWWPLVGDALTTLASMMMGQGRGEMRPSILQSLVNMLFGTVQKIQKAKDGVQLTEGLAEAAAYLTAFGTGGKVPIPASFLQNQIIPAIEWITDYEPER